MPGRGGAGGTLDGAVAMSELRIVAARGLLPLHTRRAGEATAAASRVAHHAVAITGQRPAAEPHVEEALWILSAVEVGAAAAMETQGAGATEEAAAEAALVTVLLVAAAVAVVVMLRRDPALAEVSLRTTPIQHALAEGATLQPAAATPLWSYARSILIGWMVIQTLKKSHLAIYRLCILIQTRMSNCPTSICLQLIVLIQSHSSLSSTSQMCLRILTHSKLLK
ncbi:uncharacterized protein LOC8074404 [Sorghum bicolor]|uniref:uncharacterized protein LOC8074404 n=1 Tax=Sorghum bicolor TaxID=4558 RepID=UPI000B423D9A|nr:uncharacterized protein LOC8074404 [Sorghum bicolor]|eukprot:XP_002449845.2 uncharacterized protein LOC8074404 [Sorghum bicolor]